MLLTKPNALCEQCGTPIHRARSELKKHDLFFCSNRCHGGWRTGERHHNWKGGKFGTIYTHIKHPNHPESHANGYILEHRIIAEKMTGRSLRPEEVVHHINGNKKDNRPENLMVLKNHAEHVKIHKELGTYKQRKANG